MPLCPFAFFDAGQSTGCLPATGVKTWASQLTKPSENIRVHMNHVAPAILGWWHKRPRTRKRATGPISLHTLAHFVWVGIHLGLPLKRQEGNAELTTPPALHTPGATVPRGWCPLSGMPQTIGVSDLGLFFFFFQMLQYAHTQSKIILGMSSKSK